MHVRRAAGRTLTFGHRGWLWKNSFLLYDHETDSIWHHQSGWALAGPLRGAALPRFPTVQMTFGAWRRVHPATLVLPKPERDERPLDRDVYDGRNAGLAFGLGVDLPGGFRLYPFAALRAAGGLVSEERGGRRLVVILVEDARAALAYEAPGDARDLVLEAGRDGGPLVRARGDGRAWEALSGAPVPGSGAERPLPPLLASPWEIVAWRRQHPRGSELAAPEEDAGVPAGGR